MPKFVEKEAKTIDEAIQLALEELNIDLEDAQVDILEEGSKAKLGIFGGKGAKVRVTVNIPDTKIIANFLDEIINRSRGEDDYPKYVITEENDEGMQVIKVSISGNDVSHLIGRHGDSLYAINYLASILVNINYFLIFCKASLISTITLAGILSPTNLATLSIEKPPIIFIAPFGMSIPPSLEAI